MITGDELAFVRLAMRKRLLSANLVREAVERKKWDTPDCSIPSILVSMGALDAGDAARLKRGLRSSKGSEKEKRPHATVVGRDRLAREAVDGSDDAVIDDRPNTPKKLGKYKVVKLLGAGAMGAVYHARDMELQRDVALKLLTKDGAAPTPRSIQRFKREARLAARLDHPNIVRVYEAGEDEGFNYISMEMVSGSSVSELIALGEMTPRRAVHIIRKVAEAVGYAHQQDVIHRDLKPANVLVDEKTGDARVTDFGLAVLAEGGEEDRLTRTGAAVGTPAYMAPEQVRGQLKKIDGRTDIYAIGASLYEMLTGHPPFEAPTFLELAKQICDVVPSSPRKKNSSVPLDVATICLKALEKDPQARYQKAEEMAEDLAAFLQDQEIKAQAPGPMKRFARWAKRRPALVAGLAGFMGVVLFGLAGYLTLPGELELSSQPTEVKVLIDGVAIGSTPREGFLKYELSAGTHELRFEHPDYLSRAPGAETVTIRHGMTTSVKAALVSRSGVLRVMTDPPGAEVTVSIDGQRVQTGITPFMELFVAGRYGVRLRKPGYLEEEERQVTVSTGGARAKFPEVHLVPDPAGVRIEADQDNVAVSRSGDAKRYLAPDKLPGAGLQQILATKSGYLGRRLTVDVSPEHELRRRVTLPPLVAYRVALEGRLLGRVLVRDVDGDGSRDLVALEEGPEGSRLVLLQGAGHAGATFRVQTRSRVLVDAVDVDRDGVLDILLGDTSHLEVRDGVTGDPLASLALNAYAVSVAHASTPKKLVYATERGVAQLDLTRDLGKSRHPRPDPSAKLPPTLLEVGVQTVISTLAVVARKRRGQGGVLVTNLADNGRRFFNLDGVDLDTRLQVIQTGRTRSDRPWIAVVPSRGHAYLLDPQHSGSGYTHQYTLGDEASRFTTVDGVLPSRGAAWLFLGDARTKRTRVFALGAKEATEQTKVVVGEAGTVLWDGEEPLLWTRGGDAYTLEGGGWKRSEVLSTDSGMWIAPEFEPVVVDLDGDGFTEVLAPGPDRRSLVALAPKPGWLRWRVPGVDLGALSRIRLAVGGPELLVVAHGSEVLGLHVSDGLSEFRFQAPGTVRHLVASSALGEEQRALLHVAGVSDAGEAYVLRLEWTGSAWREVWRQKREVSGLAALPFDLDGDHQHEVLVGGPLAVLLSGEGAPRWEDNKNRSIEVLGWVGPVVTTGKAALCLGASGPHVDQEAAIIAHDPSGTFRWIAKQTSSSLDPPRQILADEGLPFALVISDQEVSAVQLTDGEVRWKLGDDVWHGEVPDVVGGALVGGLDPSLVLTRGRPEVLVFDAKTGQQRWVRRLAAGSKPPSAPVVIPKGVVAQDTVALVAPNGSLLFFALEDGAYLGERRYPEGAFDPWIRSLRVAQVEPGDTGQLKVDTLLASVADGSLVALALDPLPRKRPTRRQAIREQLRRIELGEPYVGRAVAELNLLVSQGNDSQAQLALAEALLAQGKNDEALSVVKRVIEADGPLPRALRLRIVASYGETSSFRAVQPLLEELARVDAGLAAQVAVDLSDQASDKDGSRFLRMATQLAPVYGSRAHRRLGTFRLKYLAGLLPADESSWIKAKPDLLQEILKTIGDVRHDFIISLAHVEDSGARAAALLVTVLEFQIASKVLPEGNVRRNRMKAVGNQLTGLMSGHQLEVDIPPVLRAARRVAAGCLAADDQRMRRAEALGLLNDIQRKRGGWKGVIVAIKELWS